MRSTVKVTTTQKKPATVSNINMHPHTKFEIATSNNVPYMLRIRFFKNWCRFLDQDHSDLKPYATVHHINMYPQYWIFLSYSIGDMISTRFE